MQNISFNPNFNMNDIQNKNILMPNFNYNYNFNLGQMKPIDQNKIDLYNSSLSIFDKLKNSTNNSTFNANEVYNIYNMSLINLKESCKTNKIQDISKKAQFYFNLYNLINKKKCEQIDKNEYKCSFINTTFPNQPNNKKIQININNPLFSLNNNSSIYRQNPCNNKLFNGGILPGMYSFNNKNGFTNNIYNNPFSGGQGIRFNNSNLYIIDDNDINNEGTKSKKHDKKDKDEFLGKKRNADNNIISDDEQDFSSKELNNKNEKTKNNENNLNKKDISLNKDKKDFKLNKNHNKENKFNNKTKNIQTKKEANFTWPIDSEKEEEELISFQKDLKDYLRKTISDKREIIFFNNILPESLNFVRNLFEKDNNIKINKLYPIYRNSKVELSLIIEPGGKIKKQLTNINI